MHLIKPKLTLESGDASIVRAPLKVEINLGLMVAEHKTNVSFKYRFVEQAVKTF